jgi:hypothetical protein
LSEETASFSPVKDWARNSLPEENELRDTIFGATRCSPEMGGLGEAGSVQQNARREVQTNDERMTDSGPDGWGKQINPTK